MSDALSPRDSHDSRTAVLLVVHGSVDREEDVAAFVTNIRHGRPAPQAVIDEVLRRWRMIGGSPLSAITDAQGRALEARLGVRVAIGARMWHPYVQDAAFSLARQRITRVLSLPLAPYSIDMYNDVARKACTAAGIETMVDCPPWAHEPALVDGFVETIAPKLAAISGGAAGSSGSQARDTSRTHVVLSAHSLPLRVVRAGDRYEHEVRATAAAVAAKLAGLGAIGVPAERCHVAFQSQGMDGGEWLGPDLPTMFRTLADAGAREVVVAPIGFLADHTETLFDLDVEAKAQAEALGLAFHRAPALNESKLLIDVLEQVARRALGLARA
jgi:ferrochelatase